MSYQVLARKYRPQRFDQMIGHNGIRLALTNAFEKKRLHHAYLLTGTRGVGKTSLARLIAKCLNCEQKITSVPCENCAACHAIQHNHFIDLIEVDAASRTRVEDTQSLLDNVQYKPVLGRYKIYLIDEVHMLSTYSFNALLKTLEEPPSHVIFLLATTDPQKVPDTIVSRCLHFPLRNLTHSEIIQQLEIILAQEKIQYDLKALKIVAKLSKGSMRDALSFLELLILYNNDSISFKSTEALFGYVEEKEQYELIKAVYEGNTHTLKTLTESLAKKSLDFEKILDAILQLLHQIAFIQENNWNTGSENQPSSEITILSKKIQPETIQLYYQIALMGKKDLPLAPTPQLGFEMTLLRMLAFRPIQANSQIKNNIITTLNQSNIKEKSFKKESIQTLDWPHLVNVLPLTGFIKSLALHCSLSTYHDKVIVLTLNPTQKVLYNQEREALLQNMLSEYLKKDIKLHIRIEPTKKPTPFELNAKHTQEKKQSTYQSILKDGNIKAIQEAFDGTIQKENIYINTEKYHE